MTIKEMVENFKKRFEENEEAQKFIAELKAKAEAEKAEKEKAQSEAKISLSELIEKAKNEMKESIASE